MQMSALEQNDNIYTVSRLNNAVRFLLEDTFPFVWVEGEISNFVAPHSGHWYFSLKDAAAQVRCAMFRVQAKKLDFLPTNGMHVLIKARVSLYENRGEFQLIAEYMEERGEGRLRIAFEVLKKKLEAAGLFDVANKKKLPTFPQQIGIVTSSTGAAIHDILTVLKRRYPCVPIIIYPSLVQGEQAAPAIVAAIGLANQRNECDVIILARGGGSLEDLWPFNEEIVARAIYASQLPIISGIGHEIDFTIADFVADIRAPTPSAAAEIATPHCLQLLQLINRYQQQLVRSTSQKFIALKQQFVWLQKNFLQQHPQKRLTEKMQRLDFYELTLIQQQTKSILNLQNYLQQLESKLYRLTPLHRIHLLQNQLKSSYHQLLSAIKIKLYQENTALAQLAIKLDALNPLATLKRGYAIATHEAHIIQDATKLKPKDLINVRLAKGQLICRVLKIE